MLKWLSGPHGLLTTGSAFQSHSGGVLTCWSLHEKILAFGDLLPQTRYRESRRRLRTDD